MSGPEGSHLRFQPLYYADRLRVVNPVGDVGLVTLWSPLDVALGVISRTAPQILDPITSRVAVVSNLYGDGMHHMMCNLLYNPQIRHLVAVGETMGLPTCAEVEAFIKHGLEEASVFGSAVYKILGTDRVFPRLEGFDVERLQRQLSFTYLGSLAGQEASRRLPGYLAALPRQEPIDGGRRVHVAIAPPLPDDYVSLPSDVTAHQVTRRRPFDCWEELVTRTIRFGEPVTLASGPRLELLNVKAVIAEPAEDPPALLDQYGFSAERLHDYQSKMLDAELPGGISYTYGNRLLRYFRRNGRYIDTLDSAARKLTDNPESRSAYISLWDNSADLLAEGSAGSGTAPCLVTLFFRRLRGHLTLTATYRAHNLLDAWMPNTYGLMAIQQWVCARLDVPAGPLTVISHSLGIDPRAPRFEIAKRVAQQWNSDDDVDRESGRHRLREDPNGYFVLSVERGTGQAALGDKADDAGAIVADHQYKGLALARYRGSSAARVRRRLIGDMSVSLVSHALWLGGELAAKEAELRALGTEQDQEQGTGIP